MNSNDTNPSILLDAIPQVGYDLLVRLVPGGTFLFLGSLIPHVIPQSEKYFRPVYAAIPDGGAAWFLGFGSCYVAGWLLSSFGQFWPPTRSRGYPDLADSKIEDEIVDLLTAANLVYTTDKATNAQLTTLRRFLKNHPYSRLDYHVVRHLNPVAGARLLKLRAESHMLSTLRNAFVGVMAISVLCLLSTCADASQRANGASVPVSADDPSTHSQPIVVVFLILCFGSAWLTHNLSDRMSDQYKGSSRMGLWILALISRK